MPNYDASTDTWSLVDFSTSAASVDLVSDLLWGLGVVAIEEISNVDGSVTLRTSMGNDPAAAISTVSAAFPGMVVARLEIARSIADTWREHASPTHVVDDIWLVPAWVPVPEGARGILLEPLDTFGLGNHPTTVLALELALEHADLSGTVFDLGCGSGVLAVAASKLRGAVCEVYDIAENSRQAVALNADLNGIAAPTWVHERPSRPVGTVLANILAPVLIDLAPTIIGSTEPGGHMVLSGMRSDQIDRVLNAYIGTREIARRERDGWVATVLTRAR